MLYIQTVAFGLPWYLILNSEGNYISKKNNPSRIVTIKVILHIIDNSQKQ